MDPKKLIKEAAEEGNYDFTLPHALSEADKDGITMTDIENVMIYGKINQKKKNRYRMKHNDIQIVLEIIFGEAVIVTVMKEK